MLKIFKTIDKKLKKKIVYFYLLLILVTAAEFTAVFIILPISQIFFKKKVELNFFLTDYLNSMSFENLIFISLISLLLIFFIKNQLLIYFAWWKLNFINEFEEIISYRLIKKYLSKEYNFFLNYSVGNFNNFLSVEVSNFSSSLLNLLQLISEIVIFTAIALLLIYHQTEITFFLVLLILFIAIVSGYFLKKLSIKYGEIWVKSSNKINNFAIQCFNSIVEIKVYSKLKFFSDIFRDYKKQNLLAKRNTSIIGELPKPVFEFILIISFVILIYYLLKTKNFTDFPEIMSLFLAGSYRLIPAVSRFSTLFQNLKKNKYIINNFINELELSNLEEKKEKTVKINFENKIDVKKISFSFNNDKKRNKILENLEFSIKKNDLVGIVGKSGCGKTTLLNILLGFLKPTSGQVLLDEKLNIYENVEDWLKNTSYVPQNPVIINDTIKANISLSYDEVDIKKLEKSLKVSCLDEEIKNFSSGINTFLGPGSVNLSGGQKQRISIARAIYKDSEVILLDEPTSALDRMTEEKIIENLLKLEDKTIIMVTHKTELLKKFNKIIEL